MKTHKYVLALCVIMTMLSAFQPKPSTKAKTGSKKAATKPVKADSIKLSDLDYDVKFDKTVHDFGQVEEGTYAKTSFTLTNIGRSPVKINCCSTSGGHTSTNFSKEPIMPGKSGMITIQFYTDGKQGMNSKTLDITTNGGRHTCYYKCEVIERKTKNEPIKIKND
jgi:hypothetical protein